MRSKCIRCGAINPVVKCTAFGQECGICGGEVYPDYLEDEEWLPEDGEGEEEIDEQ